MWNEISRGNNGNKKKWNFSSLTIGTWVRWESSKINLAVVKGHACTNSSRNSGEENYIRGKNGAAWLKKNLEKLFLQRKARLVRLFKRWLCAHGLSLFYSTSHIRGSPLACRAHTQHPSGDIAADISRHNSNIKHLNELLYHGPARCHTRKDWIARFEKGITRRRRAYNLTRLATTALITSFFASIATPRPALIIP